MSRTPIRVALVAVLLTLSGSAHAQYFFQSVDDFETAPFGTVTEGMFQQAGLETWSVNSGVREVLVYPQTTATHTIGLYDDGVELTWTHPAEISWQPLIETSYPFTTPYPRDLTHGGLYDRFHFKVETTSEFYLSVSLWDDMSGTDTAGPDNALVMAIPGSGVYEIPFYYFKPEVDVTEIRRLTMRMFGVGSGTAKVLSLLMAGPIAVAAVDTPNQYQPIVAFPAPMYVEEWTWPDLPGPGPVTAPLQITLENASATAGGIYPGYLHAGDSGSPDNGIVGTVSGMWVESAVSEAPGGQFTVIVEWQDAGGAPMFYPPDDIHVSDRLGLVFVNSHHVNYDTGNETMLQHVFRLEVPAEMSLSTFSAQDIDGLSFELYFELGGAPGAALAMRRAPGEVFMLTSEAWAGPRDLSTAAPSGVSIAGMALEAWPPVSSGRTELRFSRPVERAGVVDIHDVRGRRVRTLAVPAGGSLVVWDGRDSDGQLSASGVYFARLVGENARVGKIVVVR